MGGGRLADIGEFTLTRPSVVFLWRAAQDMAHARGTSRLQEVAVLIRRGEGLSLAPPSGIDGYPMRAAGSPPHPLAVS
jgi:hypothetical protein